MRVGELIKRLEMYRQDLPVVFHINSGTKVESGEDVNVSDVVATGIISTDYTVVLKSAVK